MDNHYPHYTALTLGSASVILGSVTNQIKKAERTIVLEVTVPAKTTSTTVAIMLHAILGEEHSDVVVLSSRLT